MYSSDSCLPVAQVYLKFAVPNTHEWGQQLFKSNALSVVVALFDNDMVMDSKFYTVYCKYG